MEIIRVGSQSSGKGPSDWFTGTVRIDSMFQRNEPARVGGGSARKGVVSPTWSMSAGEALPRNLEPSRI
jgi:hypothetical protein